jgi:ABC-type uncharacterized transport system substrate-binding protein
LPQHAEELVKLRVAVIAVDSPPATFAAKSATSTIPIVFIISDDPVKDGFVTSFNRPGGNLTGVTVFTTAAMWDKRLELLHDLTPKAASAAILVNPRDPGNPDTTEMALAARKLGLGLSFLTASARPRRTTDAARACRRGHPLDCCHSLSRFQGSNRIPTKIGPSGCSCEMPVNEEAMMAADMIGFMESVV